MPKTACSNPCSNLTCIFRVKTEEFFYPIFTDTEEITEAVTEPVTEAVTETEEIPQTEE